MTDHGHSGGRQASLTCFFPCYNDANTIGDLVAAAESAARAWTDDYEIVVVDDGSTDGSRDRLLSLRTQIPRLKLVFHPVNRGYGAALRSGFEAAGKDLVFYTDGDGQYDVRELHKLLEALTEEVDVVNGYKAARSDSFCRTVAGRAYRMLADVLFHLPVRDVDCDFRLIRGDLLDRISLSRSSGAICIELVKKLEIAGARFVNLPVNHYPRAHGRSQFFTFRNVLSTLSHLFGLWWELFPARWPRQHTGGSSAHSERPHAG